MNRAQRRAEEKAQRRVPMGRQSIPKMFSALKAKLDAVPLQAPTRTALSTLHWEQIDAIAKGHADEDVLWTWVESSLTWHNAATATGNGIPEMDEALGLCSRLIERFVRTGRVAFSGPDYQAAKDAADVMDQLAEITPFIVARAAADKALADTKAALDAKALKSGVQ